MSSAKAERDREALEAELDETCATLDIDEIRVLVHISKRLALGQSTYGGMDLANDERDFELERSEEIADTLVYSSMLELRRVLRRRKGGIDALRQLAGRCRATRPGGST